MKEIEKNMMEPLAECRERGWQTWNFPVNVGCRGFPLLSVWRFFSAVGVTCRHKRAAIQKLGQAVEKATWWMVLSKSAYKPIESFVIHLTFNFVVQLYPQT